MDSYNVEYKGKGKGLRSTERENAKGLWNVSNKPGRWPRWLEQGEAVPPIAS